MGMPAIGFALLKFSEPHSKEQVVTALCHEPAHRVMSKNGGPCKFGVLQGIGSYDFNPVGG
jgi:hypothetical protein